MLEEVERWQTDGSLMRNGNQGQLSPSGDCLEGNERRKMRLNVSYNDHGYGTTRIGTGVRPSKGAALGFTLVNARDPCRSERRGKRLHNDADKSQRAQSRHNGETPNGPDGRLRRERGSRAAA